MHTFSCCSLFIAGTDGDQNGLDHPSVEVSLDENSGMLVDGFERTFDGKLKCRYCNYASKGTARLIEHIRIHTGNGERRGARFCGAGEGRGGQADLWDEFLQFKVEFESVGSTAFLQSNSMTACTQEVRPLVELPSLGHLSPDPHHLSTSVLPFLPHFSF